MAREMRDSDKIARLYEAYEQEMYRVAFAVLKDKCKAEDAVSESFVKLIRCRDRIGDVSSESVRRFSLKTARNTAIDMYRKGVRERKILTEMPDTDRDAELGMVDVPFVEEYIFHELELLERLSEKSRVAVELVFFEELSVREAAAVLKVSEATVRKRIERARKQLAAMREK